MGGLSDVICASGTLAELEGTVKIRYLPFFSPVFGYRMPYFHRSTVHGATVVHVALTDS